MKRLSMILLATAVVALLAVPATAFAESVAGKSGWTVTYTESGELSDNFSSVQFADEISGLQPGDDITFTVTLSHENAAGADWYMANDVIKSLEDGKAKDSAYEYKLTYNGPSGSKELYNSETVGGDNSQGLKEATSALKDFMYLDNLTKGQTATVQLVVTLDGETEQNAYFNTLAQLKMKFAVEANPAGAAAKPIVQTGDNTDLFPFYVAMTISGAVLLVIAARNIMNRRREKREGVR